MYTVLRLDFDEESRQLITITANQLNEVYPKTCDGEDRVPLRMSCTIACGNSWEEHLQKIVEKLGRFLPIINQHSAHLREKQLDILIEPEDWGPSAFGDYRVTPALLCLLFTNGIELIFTVSRP